MYKLKNYTSNLLKRSRKRKSMQGLRDNIWTVDLVDIKWFSVDNQRVKYLLVVIGAYSKYALKS